ncbi:MAG: hypothetical protein LBB83_07080 [Treponema sp.]|jgi:hypothetical protein|nr:hypothetical protein [Treponema sp.]
MISGYVKTAFLGGLLFVAVNTVSYAEDQSLEEFAVVLNIVSRVVEANQRVVWDQTNNKVTLPGVPVRMKLVGANLVVLVQFTLYREKSGRKMLVAQGQILVDVPNRGMSYHTTIETIPLEYGEQVYFFPLGRADSPEDARIEIQVALHPYVPETPLSETASRNLSTPAPEPQQ